MNRAPVTLSPGEWQVMEALWEGPKTLMELVRLLKDRVGWAKSTVTTMVCRMEEKGLIAYDQEGRTKTFRAAVSREECAAAQRRGLLERAYHGSAGALISAFVRDGSLTAAERAELRRLLDEMEV